jgi:hypothetical protein
MKWAGHVTRVGERKCAYGVLVERHVAKRPLGRASHIWNNNIKIDIKKSGWSFLVIILNRY